MKFFTISVLTAILFSSCLKESIADAMLNAKKGNQVTATLSYKISGNEVSVTVDNADQQYQPPMLGCTKETGYYNIEALSNSGEFNFSFYTDSLAVGHYNYLSTYGSTFFTDYNGTDEYVHFPGDSMSFNITSYTNGHINGNFSGVLTPVITRGYPDNIYGTRGSVLITNGSFENVPVFY